MLIEIDSDVPGATADTTCAELAGMARADAAQEELEALREVYFAAELRACAADATEADEAAWRAAEAAYPRHQVAATAHGRRKARADTTTRPILGHGRDGGASRRRAALISRWPAGSPTARQAPDRSDATT